MKRRTGLGGGAVISDDGVFFVTQDFLKPIEILDPVLSGIGLRIAFEKTRAFPRGAFQVTVVMQ